MNPKNSTETSKNLSNLLTRTVFPILVAFSLVAALISFPVNTSAVSVNDLDYEITTDGTVTILGYTCEELTGELVIPATIEGKAVTQIADYAFCGCTELTKVTLPSSLEKIGEFAFSESGITEMIVPASVTTLGGYCFMSCESLERVIILGEKISIGPYLFCYCTSLTVLRLPTVMETIVNEDEYIGGPAPLDPFFMFALYSPVETVFYGGDAETRTELFGEIPEWGDTGDEEYPEEDLPGWEDVPEEEYPEEEYPEEDWLPENFMILKADWHYDSHPVNFHGTNCILCNECGKYFDYSGKPLTGKVTFKNWDGSVISSKEYAFGESVKAPAAPTKPADAAYTYTFSGWDKQVSNVCTGDATYTAQFKQSAVTTKPTTTPTTKPTTTTTTATTTTATTTTATTTTATTAATTTATTTVTTTVPTADATTVSTSAPVAATPSDSAENNSGSTTVLIISAVCGVVALAAIGGFIWFKKR